MWNDGFHHTERNKMERWKDIFQLHSHFLNDIIDHWFGNKNTLQFDFVGFWRMRMDRIVEINIPVHIFNDGNQVLQHCSVLYM